MTSDHNPAKASIQSRSVRSAPDEAHIKKQHHVTACQTIRPESPSATTPTRAHFDPPPLHWQQLLLSHTQQRLEINDATTATTRKQLGLQTQKPIVLTGHQPGFHHAGIAAKAFAAAQLAIQTAAQAVWIVVDHDYSDPLSLHLPAGNTRIPTTTRPSPAQTPRQLPPATCTVQQQPPENSNKQTPSARAAVLLNRHADAPSLAVQAARAYLDHLGLIEHFTILPASTLANTDRFQQLTAQLVTNTFSIITDYNAAAAANPKANVRPLAINEPAWFAELPLWQLPEKQARQPVTLDEAQHWFDHTTNQPTEHFHAIRDQLAPRAIFMTLLCRLDIADLFIHGQGGHKYELVTNHWYQHWKPASKPLAPVTLVTADAYPTTPDVQRQPTPQQARLQHQYAQWLARSAAHNPHLINDDDACRTKQTLLKQIINSKQTHGRGDQQTAELHRKLREHLQSYRKANAVQLATLTQQASEADRQLEQAKALADRTISTLALPDSTLAELEHAVRSAFNPASP